MSETLTCEADTPAGVLAFARARRGLADRAEAELLESAVAWAAMHSVDSLVDAARVWERGRETALAIAGPGAPLVAEFCVVEFAAAIGVSTETGRDYLGQAVELRYRLPRLWARVVAGDLVAWRARRIAAATLSLSVEAAGFVDVHVAHVAHKISAGRVDKLIVEAIARFMPEEAERRRKAAADGRCFHVDKAQVSLAGTADVWGTLDLADALDLDQAVAAGAARLADLGSSESLDVRRAVAAGELARHQLTLDLNTPDAQTGHGASAVADVGADGPAADDTAASEAGASRASRRRKARKVRKPRQVVLYVHLSEAAVRGVPGGVGAGGIEGAKVDPAGVDSAGVGRVENTRSPVSAEQIREWCGHPDAEVVVKPVIDLDAHIGVDSYEVPDRLVEQTALVDQMCVFPWCTRPARACAPGEHDADCDHRLAYRDGGTTCGCNLAPLCRRHHRVKTHGAWTYTTLGRGDYLWRSPHGYQFLRDHHGTLDVTRDRRPPPEG